MTKEFALVPPEAITGMTYLRTLAEAEANEALLPYIRIIRSAWNDFGLSGVLCVDNIPTVYLKEVPAPLPDGELNDLHRRFWNQGVAQTLIVADPKTVRIFSGLARPQKDEASLTANSPSLVEILPLIEYTQKAASIYQSTANGSWYIQHAGKYRANSSVDAYLLDNLVGLHNGLTKADAKDLSLETQTANALIGRILFVCYLADRGIVTLPDRFDGMKLHEALKLIQDDADAISFLYDLFGRLKDDFNGSMFDQDLAAEQILIKPFQMQQIRHFLGGQKIGSPQHNLGFWAYDFNLIPVETISAIYEEFLTKEDPNKKRETGAFYTPRFLAEMTIDVAVEGRSDWHTLRYLDPCCGSGIFLVTLFNRIANKWNFDHPGCEDYLTKAEALKTILNHNIRGVDLNPTACRLACFSLYIAFLDSLSPSDIRTYVLITKHKLPYLIAGTEPANDTECIPVVNRADFLDNNGLPKEGFDCVIGNPPWEGRSSKQLAVKILEQAERYLVSDGEGCLLLPSKMFLNAQTNKFQARWLNRVIVERVIQLVDYRFILFEQAICPAMIVRYRKQLKPGPAHRIAYETPKFHPSARRRGLITIGSQDHKWLSQAQVREAAKNSTAPVIWKRLLWGTGRDLRLLSYLETFPKLQDRIDVLSELKKRKAERTKPWSIGQGLKPFKLAQEKSDRPLVPMPWDLSTSFIAPKDLQGTFFAFDKMLSNFETHLAKKKYRQDVLYSSPPKELFAPPFVLINQGYDNFVFSNCPVVFQHSLQSISGPSEDEDLLLFLTVYLRSLLAKFFLFHTAANWGTERDKVHLDELLLLPFPLPGDAPGDDAVGIVRQVAARMRQERSEQERLYDECLEQNRKLYEPDEQAARKEWLERRKERTKSLQAELEPLIYQYFGLHEAEVMLLEDTVNISIPSSTPSEAQADRFDLPTLQAVSSCKVNGYENGLAAYAETLAGTLNSWATERGSKFRVRPSGGVDEASGVAMVTLDLGQENGSMTNLAITGKLSHWLKQGLEASVRQSPSIRSEREMLWFDGKRIHIIRPATLLHWTRTAALNDADTIYGEIAVARRHVDA